MSYKSYERIIDNLVKSQTTPFHEARENFISKLFEVNSNGSTLNPRLGLNRLPERTARRQALDLLTDFL